MSLWSALFRSTVGKKFVMAITGLVLFVFVIGHMLGNLQIFLGPEVLNAYAAFLKSVPELLWGARVVLLASVMLHIWAAVTLCLANRAVRPVGYHVTDPNAASYASRTMIWSGVIVLAFIVYHLLQFTFGVVDPAYLEWKDAAGRHDVYRMVVSGFSHPLVSLFYLISMGLLCMHLNHGVSSLFQSLGLREGIYRVWIDRFAVTAAWVIFLGNISMPIAIWFFGYGKEALIP